MRVGRFFCHLPKSCRALKNVMERAVYRTEKTLGLIYHQFYNFIGH
jgi:hypothetical protein